MHNDNSLYFIRKKIGLWNFNFDYYILNTEYTIITNKTTICVLKLSQYKIND